MRVISGSARGRALKAVPGTGTRPTTDKVKEAIFSMIGPYFEGGSALDLFAGTGGLGIESLSRGIDKAVFIDIEKKSVEVIQENLRTARMEDKAEVYRNEAGRALKVLAKRGVSFDLVFLDPPYRLKTIRELIEAMETLQLLNPGAILVVETDASDVHEEAIGGVRFDRRAVYGDTAVSIFQYAGPSERS